MSGVKSDIKAAMCCEQCQSGVRCTACRRVVTVRECTGDSQTASSTVRRAAARPTASASTERARCAAAIVSTLGDYYYYYY